MRRLMVVLATLLACVCASGQRLVLRYDKPATRFEEALPLGNGHLGATVSGGVADDLIWLNEGSLWGGCANPDNNPVPTGGPELLAEVRALLEKEDWIGAEKKVMGLQGKYVNSYLPMGTLHLRQSFENDVLVFDYSGNNAALPESKTSSVEGYLCTLDLDNAIATTSFVVDGVEYSREIFVSHPDRVMVMHLTSSEEGKLEFDLDGATMWDGSTVQSLSSNEYLVKGQVGYYQSTKWEEPFSKWQVGPNGEKGMRYQFRVKVVRCDGQVYTSPCLHVSGASDVLILVSAATSFNGFDKRPDIEGRDENALAESFITKAEKKDLAELRNAHIADYQKLFGAVKLVLGPAGGAAELRPYSAAASPELSRGATREWTRPGSDSAPAQSELNMTTDKRLEAYAAGAEDLYLETLYFQFGTSR